MRSTLPEDGCTRAAGGLFSEKRGPDTALVAPEGAGQCQTRANGVREVPAYLPSGWELPNSSRTGCCIRQATRQQIGQLHEFDESKLRQADKEHKEFFLAGVGRKDVLEDRRSTKKARCLGEQRASITRQ